VSKRGGTATEAIWTLGQNRTDSKRTDSRDFGVKAIVGTLRAVLQRFAGIQNPPAHRGPRSVTRKLVRNSEKSERSERIAICSPRERHLAWGRDQVAVHITSRARTFRACLFDGGAGQGLVGLPKSSKLALLHHGSSAAGISENNWARREVFPTPFKRGRGWRSAGRKRR